MIGLSFMALYLPVYPMMTLSTSEWLCQRVTKAPPPVGLQADITTLETHTSLTAEEKLMFMALCALSSQRVADRDKRYVRLNQGEARSALLGNRKALKKSDSETDAWEILMIHTIHPKWVFFQRTLIAKGLLFWRVRVSLFSKSEDLSSSLFPLFVTWETLKTQTEILK